MAIFNFTRRAPKLRYYGDVVYSLTLGAHAHSEGYSSCRVCMFLLEISRRTRWWCLKCVIVYPARDIRPFVMYCVNGKPRSSLYTYRVYRLYDIYREYVLRGSKQMNNNFLKSPIAMYFPHCEDSVGIHILELRCM